MIRSRVLLVVDEPSFPPLVPPRRSDGWVRRRCLQSSNPNSGQRWSALRISGVVILIWTVVTFFLLQFLARKLRKSRPIGNNKGLAKISIPREETNEGRNSQTCVDFSFLTASMRNNMCTIRKEPRRHNDGYHVDSSSSSHSSDENFSSNELDQEQLKPPSVVVPYCMLSESSSSTDSQRLPQLQELRYSRDRELMLLFDSSASSPSPNNMNRVCKTRTHLSQTGSTTADTPITTLVTVSGSSSCSLRPSNHESSPSNSATENSVNDDLPSSSSLQFLSSHAPYSSLNADGTVATLTSIGLVGIPDRSGEEGRPVNDIPFTITTKQRYHRRMRSYPLLSAPSEAANSLQMLFGRLNDTKSVVEHPHQALVVSVNDEEEPSLFHDSLSSSFRNHRQLLICGPTDADDQGSSMIPLWVSNEESMVHHIPEEE